MSEHWYARGGYVHAVDTPYDNEPVKTICGTNIGRAWGRADSLKITCDRCIKKRIRSNVRPMVGDERKIPLSVAIHGGKAENVIAELTGTYEKLVEEGWENVMIDWESDGGWGGECYEHNLVFIGRRPMTDKEIAKEKRRIEGKEREKAEAKAAKEAAERAEYERLKAIYDVASGS